MTTLTPQLIIVDGLDRCGKSTFIEYIREKYSDTCPLVIRSTKPPEDLKDPKQYQLNFYKDQIKSIIETIKDYEVPIILDRSYLGEFVYGTIYRNCSYSEVELQELEKPLQEIKTTLFVFTDIVQNRLDRDDGKSLSVNPENLEKEYELFQEWYSKSSIKNKTFVNWYYEEEFSDEAFTRIIERTCAPGRDDLKN